jgi:Ni,Fe-hydrogenase III small subunit
MLLTFLPFRRIRSTEAQIVEIQWEKYGNPRFVVNFGRCPKDGVVFRGEHFPVEKIYAGWLVGGGRLKPGHGRTTAGGLGKISHS